MELSRKFIKSFTLFFILFLTLQVQNYLNGMGNKGKEHAVEAKFKTKELESLQQKDFANAALDCGYFALHNAIQMVQSINESSLEQSLKNKDQFNKDYAKWKLELKKGTFLSADEIDKILEDKKNNLPEQMIYVLGDPSIFQVIKEPNINTEQELQTWGFGKILKLVKDFCKFGKSFALIYRTGKFAHWITYGVKKENAQINIFITNSLKMEGFFGTEEEAIKTEIDKENQKNPNLTEQDIANLKKAIALSFKDFEDGKKELASQMMQNAEILKKFIEFEEEQKNAELAKQLEGQERQERVIQQQKDYEAQMKQQLRLEQERKTKEAAEKAKQEAAKQAKLKAEQEQSDAALAKKLQEEADRAERERLEQERKVKEEAQQKQLKRQQAEKNAEGEKQLAIRSKLKDLGYSESIINQVLNNENIRSLISKNDTNLEHLLQEATEKAINLSE